MLRSLRTSTSSFRWTKPRRVAGSVAITTAAAAVTATAYYYGTTPREQRRGLQRQAFFWTRLVPIVADYYWHFGAKSPRPWIRKANEEETSAERKARRAQLHQRHAPQVLQVMLDLKGLYVKLGQVLSVTALPIPDVYRQHFRTLQSDVPGYEAFEAVQQVLCRELQTDDLESIFVSIDPIPCGAASIGQAHRAVLRDNQQEVIVKVQYPDASWQVPADIQCVGGLLRVCILTGVVDETAARISFDDFARQFIAELNYVTEAVCLQETYESSTSLLIPNNPYRKHGVVVPHIYPHLCTEKVITMSYLEGPKLEQEARQQLEALGIDTSQGIGGLVRAAARKREDELSDDDMIPPVQMSWIVGVGQRVGKLVGVDTILWTIRNTRRIWLWSSAMTARTLGLVAPILPEDWNVWRESHILAYNQARRLAMTGKWIDALLDVHGYQIFQQGLFNADCHPGNILVVEDDKLGLIDYGQCKRLTSEERARVAHLVLSVARKESDEQVARAFRNLGVQTKNDSTEFLAEMARLMFGRFEMQHLDHAYHRRLHTMDRITYFPKEVSMVYRTSLLLRGLAVSLQANPSIAEHWQEHAQAAVAAYPEDAHTIVDSSNNNTNRRHVTRVLRRTPTALQTVA